MLGRLNLFTRKSAGCVVNIPTMVNPKEPQLLLPVPFLLLSESPTLLKCMWIRSEGQIYGGCQSLACQQP